MKLDKEFWNGLYEEKDTGWNIGYPSTPLKEYIDQLDNQEISILIPGCGNSYEGEYLFENKFNKTHIVDIAEEPLRNFSKRVSTFPRNQLYCENFFEHKGEYDLILEQTFFCAIDPSLRTNYAKQAHRLLKPKGKLVGLLFDEVHRPDPPPFGGTTEEYTELFEPLFEIQTMEPCYNSIKPRSGREVFIILEKKE